MKRLSVLILALAVLHFALPAASAEQAAPAGAGRAEVVKTEATVLAVDIPNRVLSLRGPMGNTFTVTVAREVQNLSQLKVRDRVVVAYYEAAATELRKSGGPPRSARNMGAPARPGEKSAHPVSREVKLQATVEAVDEKNSLVRLKRQQGDGLDLRVQDPKLLKGIRIGDIVEATYIEARAVALEPAPKK